MLSVWTDMHPPHLPTPRPGRLPRHAAAAVATALALVATLLFGASPPVGAEVAPGGTTAARCFTNQSFLVFLDRRPGPEELDQEVDRLQQGEPRSALIARLASSDEWLSVTVDQIYRDALGRPAEPAGLAFWVGELRRGVRVNRIGAGVYGSNEYYRRSGDGGGQASGRAATPETFVRALYGDILDRDASDEDVAYWQGQLPIRGQGGVALQFFASAESRRQRVRNLYQGLLGRMPSETDAAFWVDRLRTVNDVRLAVLIASSDEFAELTRTSCSEFALLLAEGRLPQVVEGQPYSASLTVSQGAPPYTITAAGLPAGLSVVGTEITGTAMPEESGAVTVTITVTDADGSTLTRDLDVEVVVPSVGDVVVSDTGANHSCAVLSDSSVRCWGNNDNGELGITGQRFYRAPVEVPGVAASAISAGGAHSCALAGDGAVTCWGRNDVGQLGLGTTSTREAPAPVPGLSGVTAVSAGGSHSCAVLADTSAACWGINDHGQLGDGSTTERSAPVAVAGLTGVVAISAGGDTSCAVLEDGTARCWGWGAFGRLGNGSDAVVDQSTPVPVVDLTDAVDIDAGEASCATRADGTAACWGIGNDGVLGNGVIANRNTATPVTGLTGAVDITVGSRTACAVRADGTAACWGRSEFGALGTGTDPDPVEAVTTPVEVDDLDDAVTVAAGGGNACVLTEGGFVRCWGRNNVGQLGLGDTVGRPGPTTAVVNL